MARTYPILYPAPEVHNILVSSIAGHQPATTAQFWLNRGHYIFDAATTKPLTVQNGELCTIVYPSRMAFTRPLPYNQGGAYFDIGAFRYVYTRQIQDVDRAIGNQQRALLAAGVAQASLPRKHGWKGKDGGVGQWNHPQGILSIEGMPDGALEPAERACKAWLRTKVPFPEAAGRVALAGLVAESHSVVRHPRLVASADDVLAGPAAKEGGRRRAYSG